MTESAAAKIKGADWGLLPRRIGLLYPVQGFNSGEAF